MEVQALGGFYKLTWPEFHVEVQASRVHEHRDSTTAELRVRALREGHLFELTQGSLNLLAPRTRKQWADLLEEQFEGPDWRQIMEDAAAEVLERHRQGEPVEEVNTTNEIPQPGYFIRPIMPDHQPTIIFGRGATAKSLMSLVLGAVALLPWHDNPLELVPARQTPLGYFDWETDKNEVEWRTKCLTEGMGLGFLSFQYRRCYRPLADDIEQIQAMILEHKLGLIIIDSLGLACGGDQDKSEAPLRFFAALRQLGVTSLIITHESKGEGGKDGPINSVYFFNMARSIWRATRYGEEENEEFDIVLKHLKANNGMLRSPLAYHIKFPEGGPMTIRKTAPESIEEFMEKAPISKRILKQLTHGMATPADLAAELDANENLIQKTLSQLKGKGLVINLQRGTWGLMAHE